MKVDFTLRRFPASGTVKDQCSLPFSCVLQPLARSEDAKQSATTEQQEQRAVYAEDVARCQRCYAYACCYSSFDSVGWTCALCGTRSDHRQLARLRYCVPQSTLQALPEVCTDIYEAVVEELGTSNSQSTDEAAVPAGPAPVYIALVDTCCEDDFLEVVKSALLAALEALPPTALFGLITYSNKIGLCDLQSASFRYVPIFGNQNLIMPLSEALPLPGLLCPVGFHKESISEAVEQLQADASSSSAHAAPPGQQNSMDRRTPGLPTGRAFGTVLLGVLDYVKALAQPPFSSPYPDHASASGTTPEHLPAAQCPMRLMVFMSGPADMGPGRLVQRPSRQSEANRPSSDGASSLVQLLDPTSEASKEAQVFYEQTAVAAASLGVCCDLYAVSSTVVGLSMLEPLCSSTGGSIFLYPSAEESAMPQDVYRRLAAPSATAGLLRVRTSPQFKVTRYYGRLFQDQQIENLVHIIGCDSTDTFAADFDYTSPAGFNEAGAPQPTIQVAFQYTVLVPKSSSSQTANGAQLPEAPTVGAPKAGKRFVLQRRLRVATFRLHISSDPMEIYRHANTDAIVTVLLHKIMRAAHSSGVDEARLLLRDWLVILALQYHRHVHKGLTHAQLAAVPVDLMFSTAEALQPLPRLVYALLRSPLLAAPAPGQHPDLTAFLKHLWACLPPNELVRAIYPLLASYSDTDEQAYARHSLSRAALSSTNAPIFFLDAFVLMIIYYTARAGPYLPFPPPQQSGLRKAVAAVRQERKITPQVKFLREGTEGADLFQQLLLDEPDAPSGDANGSNASKESGSGFGLLHFLDHIQQEAAQQLGLEAARAAKQQQQ